MKIVNWLLGAAKAVVAGIAVGGAAVAIDAGADPKTVGLVGVVLAPLFVYITRNKER
jgi:hypothetical protein